MTVAVRTDHDAPAVRALAKAAATPEQARRLLAIALIIEGASRADAARSTGMDRQTLRDWVHRFNAEGPEGLCDRKAPGRSRRLDTAQLAELKARVAAGPEPAQDGLVRWRLADLCGWAEARFQSALARMSFAVQFSVLAVYCSPWVTDISTGRILIWLKDERTIADLARAARISVFRITNIISSLDGM